ncbi:hypothetical protein PENTCL1PPCAC_17082, partial [Pristionchus entomophagus]
ISIPVGKGELDLSVQSTWTEQGGIQSVLSVRGHDHLDIGRLVESVHLIEQLEQDTTDLSISSSLGIESLRGDGINLINEDDRGRVLLRQTEHVTNHAGS